jgi:hypothetical protein
MFDCWTAERAAPGFFPGLPFRQVYVGAFGAMLQGMYRGGYVIYFWARLPELWMESSGKCGDSSQVRNSTHAPYHANKNGRSAA